MTDEASAKRNLTRPLSLRKNASWAFLGNVVYRASQWGIIVILAKLGTPEMVGVYFLGLAVTAPVISFSSLSLRTVQITDANNQYLFADYLGLRLITAPLAFLIIAAIIGISGYHYKTSLVILLIGIAKTIENISDIFHGLFQQRERMDRIAQSLVIKGPLSLVALFLGVHLMGSILWGVVGMILVWLLILALYDIRIGADILKYCPQTRIGATSEGAGSAVALRPCWNLRRLLALAGLSLPLGVALLLASLNGSIPAYFIQYYFGEAELGIFSPMLYLWTAGEAVIGAAIGAGIPRLAKYYAAESAAAFRGLLVKLVGAAALMGVIQIGIAVLAGRPLLTILYSPEYAERAGVFGWVMVAGAITLLTVALAGGIKAARYFKARMYLLAVSMVSSAVACSFLVPQYGLYGAAFAMIVAGLVYLLGGVAVNWHALFTIGKQEHLLPTN